MEFLAAVVRNSQIILESDLTLPDGQRVEVVVLPCPRDPMPGEAILRTSGSLADDPDFDEHMAIVERDGRSAEFRSLPGWAS